MCSSLPSWQLFLLGLFCYPASTGAYTLLWGATSAEGAHFGSQVRILCTEAARVLYC